MSALTNRMVAYVGRATAIARSQHLTHRQRADAQRLGVGRARREVIGASISSTSSQVAAAVAEPIDRAQARADERQRHVQKAAAPAARAQHQSRDVVVGQRLGAASS